MKILGIIPARSGSKGLRNKNIKPLLGTPLMAYTITSAIKSKVFDTIMVSTDSTEYAKIAKKFGASVPFLRDKNLAKDESTTRDVILSVLKTYEKKGMNFTHIMILQPTSPLRTEFHICESVHLYNQYNARGIVSVCEAEHSPLLCNTLPRDCRLEGFLNIDSNKRRQDLDKYYRINGAIYLFDVEYYIENENLYGQDVYAYIMENKASIDIDNEYDFSLAEFFLSKTNE